MKSLFIILFIMFFSLDVKAISGGIDADRQPYMVSISSNYMKCSGVLIHQEFVLTAEHCLSELTQIIDVIIGDYDRSIQDGEAAIRVSRIFTFDIDLALLQLEREENLEHVIPIRIITNAYQAEEYQLFGWGLLDNLQPATKLQTVAQIKGEAYNHRVICTYNIDNSSINHGDSGGALIANNVLVGIIITMWKKNEYRRSCSVDLLNYYQKIEEIILEYQHENKLYLPIGVTQ